MELKEKQTLSNGRYVTQSQIGSGPFGTVYLIRDNVDRIKKAIKLIQNKKMNRCLSERRRDRIDLILNLDSPYILKYYDMFLVNDSIHSFVMELCEQGDLEDRIRESKSSSSSGLSKKSVYDWTVQILKGLIYLHSNDIVHRNLKPRNVLFDSLSMIRLSDFDIFEQPESELLIGDCSYMSPEMISGRAYDHKADLWSFGCIVYEMLNLEKAFQGKELTDLINSIKYKSLDNLINGTSEFKFILVGCLQRDTTQRIPALDLYNTLRENESPATRPLSAVRLAERINSIKQTSGQVNKPDLLLTSSCKIKLWDLESGSKILVVGQHDGCIRALALASESQLVVSGGEDSLIHCWDMNRSFKLVHTFKGHKNEITSLCLSASERLLYSGSRDNTVRCWNFARKEEQNCLRVFRFDSIWGPYKLHLLNDEQMLLADLFDELIVWKLVDEQDSMISLGKSKPYRVLSNRRDLIIVRDGISLLLFDSEKNKVERKLYENERTVIKCLEMSDDESSILFESDNKTIKILNLRNLNVEILVSFGNESYNQLSAGVDRMFLINDSNNKPRLITYTNDKEMKLALWSLTRVGGKCLKKVNLPSKISFYNVDLSSSRRYLIISSVLSMTVKIVDASSLKLSTDLKHEHDTCFGLLVC